MDIIIDIAHVWTTISIARSPAPESAYLIQPHDVYPGSYARSVAELESPVGRSPVYRPGLQQPAKLEVDSA